MKNFKHIDTACVQGGYQPKNGEPRTPPAILSTTFKYDTGAQMTRLFDLQESGYFYTRLQNPTNDMVAGKICELEGGHAAMLTSSGQAASFFSLFNLCSAGDHVIASSAIYGGTFNLIAVTMKRMGIECTFVHPDDPEEKIQEAFKENTKAVFAESLANAALIVLDIEKFARLAHKNGVPLIIDNTFPTPVNCRVFDYGADIAVHSTTKYMDGHGTCVGGAIVDSGNFDWEKYADKFPGLTTPDDSYHGVTYTKAFGKSAYIVKCTAQLMRDFGAIPAPINSFILNQHLESLALRVARHCENGKKIAEFLSRDKRVEKVKYPGLKSDKYYALAEKYMPKGSSGVLCFDVKGGADKAEAFMDALKIASVATHVADARSCVLRPAGTTHRQLTPAQLEAAGLSPALVRFSAGLENADDIIADIDNALSK